MDAQANIILTTLHPHSDSVSRLFCLNFIVKESKSQENAV